jgi:16S rRNA (cytosine967-C5)-methyltransferase
MNPSSLAGHVVELCELIDQNTVPADKRTADFFKARKYLGSHDRRYISGVVYGIVRHRRFLEALLEQIENERAEYAGLNAARVRYLPLYASYLIAAEANELSRVVEAVGSRWKMVFPKIELSRFWGWMNTHKNLDFLRVDETVRLGVKYSLQDWMVERLQEQFGEETEQLLSALNEPAATTIRVNRLKATREECRARLLTEGINSEPTKFSPDGLIVQKRFNRNTLDSFKDGWFEMQDEGSQIVSWMCGVKPGEFILDACAGAGGKTLHLAEMMQNEGELIAIDVDEKRLFELQTRAARAGLNNIKVCVKDRLNPEEYHCKADMVLVDAPCSGSGTIRRNPSLKWTLTESLVEHYAKQQKEILAYNSAFVKPEGRLVYATCSLFRQENEEIVAAFLKESTEFIMETLNDSLSRLGIEGNAGTIKLLPHMHGTDGFYVTVMKKGEKNSATFSP